jgi:hypothetical protein
MNNLSRNALGRVGKTSRDAIPKGFPEHLTVFHIYEKLSGFSKYIMLCEKPLGI